MTTEPEIKKSDNVPRYGDNGKMLIILSALLIVGIFLNGFSAFLQALVCVGVSLVCDYFAFKLIVKKSYLYDMSALVMGLSVALLLPADAPLYVGAFACAFGIVAAKLPFGNYKNTPFLPSAAAIVFCCFCFPEYMSRFSSGSNGWNLVFSDSDAFIGGTTLNDMLSIGDSINLNAFSVNSLLCGSYPGAIGVTSMLAMVGVMLFILFTNKRKLCSSFGFILAGIIFAVIFPRVNSGFFTSIVMELSAGSFMFCALISVNDSVTSPALPLRSFLYGLIAGIICMLLRHFSTIADAPMLSVLAINALWPVLSGETVSSRKRLPDKKQAKKASVSSKEKSAEAVTASFKNNQEATK